MSNVKERKIASGWEPWFAWYPVETDQPRSKIDGRRFAWNKTIYRYWVDNGDWGYWAYVQDFPEDY